MKNSKNISKCISFTIVLCTLVMGSLPAWSDTLARVFPIANQGMISVYRGRFGSDHDGKFLFDAMNVPAQQTYLGLGKTIKASGQVFSWVCADRGKDGYQCTIMLQKSAETEIHDGPSRLRYEVTGVEAATLLEQLFPNTSEATFKFQNEEGTLKINASRDRFTLVYAE